MCVSSVMSNDRPLSTVEDHRERGKTFFSKRSRGFAKALGVARLPQIQLRHANPQGAFFPESAASGHRS